MSLFAAAPPSYAQEQLRSQLGSLATLPVSSGDEFTASDAEPAFASDRLKSALSELTQAKPPSMARLGDILHWLSTEEINASELTPLDRTAEAEVITRAVSLIWAKTMEVFVDGSLKLEDDRTWWEVSLSSKTRTFTYYVQTLPWRVYCAASESIKPGTFSQQLHSLHWPSRDAMFSSLHDGKAVMSQRLLSMASPLQLTRREMAHNLGKLTSARNAACVRVGELASQGPRWSSLAVPASVSHYSTVTSADLTEEATRVYSMLCDVLDVTGEGEFCASPQSGRVKQMGAKFKGAVTPVALLEIIDKFLPRAEGVFTSTLHQFGRPSKAMRLWFPCLFLPPALYFTVSALVRNKDWMKEQVSNAKDTVKGFFVQWVWEPVEDIASTMRGGGKGLDVSPETVKADQQSLERMVVDLGRDYYHLSGDQLDELKKQVETGNMSAVLKVYEQEMQSPIKNALTGNLVRTLLIQVQKTKTDLSLSLQSLDQLLRSQQLTFAFVGVAPSVLLLWGAWGWLSRLWSGENWGKSRRRRYFHGMRDVERLLIAAPEDDARMTDRDRGMIIVSVSGLRTWATGMSTSRQGAFLDDLRMVEDPALGRDDKLHVVNRIWRCWGLDGRKVVV